MLGRHDGWEHTYGGLLRQCRSSAALSQTEILLQGESAIAEEPHGSCCGHSPENFSPSARAGGGGGGGGFRTAFETWQTSEHNLSSSRTQDVLLPEARYAPSMRDRKIHTNITKYYHLHIPP